VLARQRDLAAMGIGRQADVHQVQVQLGKHGFIVAKHLGAAAGVLFVERLGLLEPAIAEAHQVDFFEPGEDSGMAACKAAASEDGGPEGGHTPRFTGDRSAGP
jgi:hypothetical protein